MTDPIQALFRIDPTEGLMQYVEAIKPFHSKVLDVFVEYIYSEALTTTITDRCRTTITLLESQRDVEYSCGFGFVWNPYSMAAPGDLPQATIISATGELHIAAAASGATLTLTPEPSGYVFSVNDPVIFITTGTFPPEIQAGLTYYVQTVGVNLIAISETVGGPPIIFTGAGTGQLSVIPQGLPYNTFLVSASPSAPIVAVVSNLQSNQLTLTTPYTITGVNTTLKQWTITGAPVLVPGDVVYVSGNTDTGSNGKYQVVSAAPSGPSTVITVSEPISITAAVSGRVNVPIAASDVPYWPAGAAVKLSSTGGFPFPLDNTTTYYFNPTTTFGVFNLGKVRYPQQYSDIVDLQELEVDQLTIYRSEPFVPGEMVTVTGSFSNYNDGVYIITTITPEGSNFRLQMPQHIPQMTPVGQPTDGTMTYTGSYGDPFCAIVSAPDLYTAPFFHERIVFEFDV